MARQLAEQAYTGQYGVQEDATALLRSIDTEEYRQKQRVARDTYEAGRSAFLRKDYQYAAAILRSLDVSMLTDLQKSQLRDLLALPEMQANRPPVSVASKDTPVTGSDNPNDPGRARATDEESRQSDLIHQSASLENIKVQKLRRESIEKMSTANARAREGNLDSAIEILQRYLDDVSASDVQSHDVEMMRRQVDNRLHQYETMRDQNARYQAVDDKTKQAKDKVARNQLAEQNKQQRLKELMDEYTKLYKAAKYAEAQTYAEQAHDIDPDNPVVTAAMQIAQTQRRLTEYRKLEKDNDEFVVQGLNEPMKVGPPITAHDPLKYDKDVWNTRVKNRKPGTSILQNRMSPAERDIEQQMSRSVSVAFKDLPLGQALEDLSTLHTEKRINIFPDEPAMRDAGVTLDRPVTIRVDNISLKSTLNLLLSQVGLTWTIKDDALVITTKEKAKGDMQLRYYQVTELVVPLDAPTPNTTGTLIGQTQNVPPNSGVTGPTMPTAPSPGSSGSGSAFASTGTGNGGGSMMSGTWVKGGGTTRENELIQFIQETISPKSWAAMGGQGTINYFPMTMTLAINQNPQVQEDISDLLNSLRRLQDVEVAVEYRLISLDEDFYEKIGVDFAMNIINQGASKYQPALLSGAFQAPGQIQTWQPEHFLTGLTPAGTFTSDLGFPIASSSYNLAYNNLFGGFPNNPLGNGGINLGLAFLSDIQVFMLLEAAQGNNRAQVMQAPRVTAFNGQQATMTAANTQPYSLGGVFTTGTALNTLQFTPVTTNLTNRSASISVTPVISADRRFVRLTQTFTLSNTVPTIPLFPIVQALPIIDGGNGVGFTLVTNYIQQPAQDFMSVSTSVAVPDGGTVLIGGFKQLSESRSEYGPPLIGKIPYLDRLFRNVGYGREIQNLVFLVTPRIIINEEEELMQTGGLVNAPR
jgi:type II secretory pathway component GspD/PulD (secretin)